MKLRSIMMTLLLFYGALSTLYAQSWNVTVFMQPFPSPYLSDWENNPTIGSLTITNNTATPTDALIHLTIARTNGSVLATGTSNPVTTQPGVPVQVNSDRFIDWNTVSYDAGSRDQAIQTGRLPEGDYNACITLRDMSGMVLVANVCAPFTIVYPNPPSLFFPMDGDSLDSVYPIFTWTPVNVPPAYQLHYVLRVVEILAGQPPHQALLANIVHYEENNLLTTSIQYPLSALPLEPGKRYAWQVQAVDQNGFPPSANQGRSEIWTFVARDPLSQIPPTTSSGPVLIKLVPRAAGGSSGGFTSFASVVQQLESGSIEVPYETNATDMEQDTITILANDGWYADHAKRSWAAKGTLWGSGANTSSSEVLFGAVWGPGMDVTRTILVWKTRFPGFTGYAVLSLREFDLKPHDLPGALAGSISTSADTTFASEAFSGNDDLELKRGLTLVGRFDLNNGQHDKWAALGVEEPYIKVTGSWAPKAGIGLSYQRLVGGDVEKERGWEAELKGEIPITREPVHWLTELNLEVGVSVEKDAIKKELKVAPKIAGVAKMTSSWLQGLNFLSDTVEVTLSLEAEWTRDSTGFQSGWPEFIVTLEFDDVIKIDRFENVFKVHDPKIEWNITKWRQNKGGLKLEAEFDIAQIEKVGTIEIELEKGESVSTRPGYVPPPTNPTTGSPGSSTPTTNTPPALPAKTNLAAMMNPSRPEPLAGAKPPSQWKPKVTAKFDPVALGSLGLSLVLRKALGDDIFGDAGLLDEFLPVGRNSSPAPPYAPPEIPDFLNNLPALQELSMSFRPGSLGSMVVKGKTSYNNSSTEFIVARAESPVKKGFLFGLKPQNWSISNHFPGFSMPGLDNLTLSNVALIFSSVEGVMPSSELSDEEFDFYSAAYGSDDFTVVIKEGLNLIAAIPGDNLGSGGPLVPLMEKVGVDRGGTLLLQGSLGTRIQDIYLLAVFPSMQPPGAPEWFRSGEMAIELTGQPSIGLAGALTVNIEGDDVTFLLKTKAGPQGLILSGGLVAIDGWQSPFGIEWLTLNRVMMLLGVTPTGSVQLGFNADMVVGTKDIDVAVLVALSPVGVPTNFLFDGESAVGFAVSDVADLHAKMVAASGQQGIPLDAMPPLGLKHARLKFAPKDAPELGISRGMAIRGLLYLESGSSIKEIAEADFDVSMEGIIARGNVAAFTLGPVKLEEASIDLTLTRSEQHFVLAGSTNLGFASAEIEMNLTKTRAFFHAETRIFNAFQAELNARGELSLTQPVFTVNGKMKDDFHSVVANQLRPAIRDIVTAQRNSAKTAADAADRKWQDAVKAREAARKKWADLPLLPRDPKVAARNAWEAAIARAAQLRIEKELAEGRERRWTLAGNSLAQLEQQAGSGNFIVVRSAEFEADLANLKTGAVKKMALDARVGQREFDLELTAWNFKNMGASVKGAAQNIADQLFASFQ